MICTVWIDRLTLRCGQHQAFGLMHAPSIIVLHQTSRCVKINKMTSSSKFLKFITIFKISYYFQFVMGTYIYIILKRVRTLSVV